MGLTDSTASINPKTFTGAKPHTHQGNLWHLHPAIAKRLAPLPNFVNWRWELNEKGDAWTKVPYQPHDPTKRAATNDKRTWGTYADAVANVEADNADGIGFCLLGTNICAFDIDDCRDLTGNIDPVATELIARCGATYVEETVSGTGLRIIGVGGTKYVNRKQKLLGSKVSIESYRNCARYITISGMTFDSVEPTLPDLSDIDALITDVVAELDNQSEPNSAKADDTTTRKGDGANFFVEASLPPDLASLIRDGVPISEDRSAAFYHAVKWLKDCGWSLDDVIDVLRRYPNGIALKYGSRFAGEAARAFRKPDKGNNKTSSTGNIGGPTAPANSEEFLALIFIDHHEADLRFVAKWGQWFRWDGSRWALEETLHAFDMARLICRDVANACNKPGVAKTLASAKTVAAVERLAKADRKLAATFEQWDTDPNKINTSEED